MNPAAEIRPPWYGSTLAVALAGSLLMWAALPPLALGWLGWFAPLPWLLLVRRDELTGRRPYAALWLAGIVFWLIAIHWLRLPHPAVYLGWFALSAYLGIYLPVFVGLSRVAVHRVGVPLWLAAPIVWTGLELARAHLLTGFLMGSLAHTQVRWTKLIQISDLFGEYGVDFVMILVSSCLAGVVVRPRQRMMLVLAPIVLLATLLYGQRKLDQAEPPEYSAPPPAGPRIALVQGNSLAEWKADPNRERQIMEQYIALSEQAVAKAREVGDGRPVDLIVWPETMFRTPLVTFAAGFEMPARSGRTPQEIASYGPQDLAALVKRLGTSVLVGVERLHVAAAASGEAEPPPSVRYNASVLVDRTGKIVGTYDKIHRVMFGEYIPFAHWLPFLYQLTPLTGGIEAGGEPAGLQLDDIVYAPNICYETAIPHVIRRQVASLDAQDKRPDVLVNLTNDAWYWGSSELDMHLACGVFRAIETRRPLVIAANGGISAWIDHLGRVRAESPRQQPDVILADVEPSTLRSAYVGWGDWFAAVCLGGCVVLGLIAAIHLRSTRFATRQGDRETGKQGDEPK